MLIPSLSQVWRMCQSKITGFEEYLNNQAKFEIIAKNRKIKYITVHFTNWIIKIWKMH